MNIKSFIGICFLSVWLLLIIDGLVPQIEMMLFVGWIPVPTFILKAIIILICLVAIIVRKGHVLIPYNIFKWWMILVVYLLLDILILTVRYNYSITQILYGYNAYYFYLILFPILFAVQGTLHDKIISKVIILIFFPLAVFGFIQYFSSDPILPLESADGQFKILSWGFMNQIRAFSLFASGLSYGQYINIVIALGLSLMWNKGLIYKIMSIIILCTALYAAYSTLTRIVYISVLFTICAVVLIMSLKNKKNHQIITYLPAIYGVAGIVIAYGIEPLINILGFGYNNIYSPDSLILRYMEWELYGGKWLGTNLLNGLFGTGLIQTENVTFSQGIIIDNIFLAIGLHVGFIGLIIIWCIMWSIWKEILNILKNKWSSFNAGIAAVFSTWFLTGIFNLTLPFYHLLIILLILENNNKTYFAAGVK